MRSSRKCATHNATGRNALNSTDGKRSGVGMDRIVELVGLVYDAALDPDAWPETLNKSVDAIDATNASLGTSNERGCDGA
jgi:hypothetical protein